MKVVLGTKNEHKLTEFLAIFKAYNYPINLVSVNLFDGLIQDPIENGKTFRDNAIIKAKYYYDLFKIPVIADDSGLCVDALDGEPGIYSARYASDININANSSDNRKKLLSKLQNLDNRKAHFTACIVFYDGTNLIVSEGNLYGQITLAEKGNNGFGYDSIFKPDGYEQTLAEMDECEKNKISHRYKAIKALINQLSNMD